MRCALAAAVSSAALLAAGCATPDSRSPQAFGAWRASNGASVAWSRVPFTLGCCARWNEDTRKTHYQKLVSVENRLVLAGEHASYIGCWMEGAILSSLDAVTRLHRRALEA